MRCDVLLLFPQAVLRRKELEKSVQWAQENDKTLRQIQESLANTDRHLAAYLTDHIDAQQIPQEAQVAISVCFRNDKSQRWASIPELFPRSYYLALSNDKLCCYDLSNSFMILLCVS